MANLKDSAISWPFPVFSQQSRVAIANLKGHLIYIKLFNLHTLDFLKSEALRGLSSLTLTASKLQKLM